MKIDPPVEPVQHAEVATEPPVTPIASRTRPEETDSTADLSSWASPAFFQRSRASFGPTIDTRLDPFAEDDGFVPGKGRKRPRFSMRSSEWRVVDEPASPGEKTSSVDWTAELEDESLEKPEVDEEGTMEDINARREEPKIEEPLPEVEGLSGATPVEDITVPTDQPIPEINFGVEQPVEPESTHAAEAALPVSEKADAYALHIPMETPRLLPVPSPGLPVPSPLVSTPDSQQGYFASAAAATQTRAPTTMTGLSQSTAIEDNVVFDIQPEPSQADTAAAPVPEVMNGDMSTNVSEFVTESDVPQKPAPTLTAGAIEPLSADNIKSEEERLTGGDHEGHFSATLTGTSVEEEARIKDDASHSEDIKMEEIEDQDVQQSSSDEQDEDDLAEEEDNEEHPQKDEESDKDEKEEIKSEEGEGEHDGQAIGFQNAETYAGRITEAEGRGEGLDEAADDESDSAQSRTQSYSGPEEGHGHYIEDQDEMYDEESEEEEDEEESESEQGYENEKEELVDSEIDSGEESDEQPHQAQPQAPSKSAQAEVIVLDSDDEDEQPAPNAQMQMPIQPKEEQPEESVDNQELYDERPEEQDAEDWSSGEEEEVDDEVMADGQSDEEHYDYGDEYEEEEQTGERVEDERVEDERVEDERVEDEQEDEEVEDGVASDEQEQGSLADEQEEDQEEVADTAIPEEKGATHIDIDTEEDLRTNIQDEAHVTEDIARQSEHDIHERDAPTVQDLSGPAIDISSPQFDASAEDAVLNENRERVDQPSEVSEHPPTTEPYQGADPGLIYDGHASPRAAHEPLPLPPDSLLDQPDRSQEAEPSHQVSANQAVDEMPTTPQKDPDVALQAQIELSAKSDDVPVDMFGTPEEEPRFRSLSMIHQQQLEINEHAADQNSHIPAKLGEDELIQLQEGLRARDGVSEESETYTAYTEQDAVPDRQYPGLRSKLSYFAPLSTLVDHFHTLVDTISIVHDTSTIYQSAAGKKDYTLELLLTDPSLAGNTLTARLYRPYKEALPSLSEGDAILLRNFTVKSSNHSMTLVSVDTSAWAVFSNNNPENNEAEISGPPVEYGPEELSHATDLRQWYQEDGAAMVADNQLQASLQIATGSREITPIDSVATSDSGGLDSIGRDGRRDFSRSLRRGRKSHRRITIHELRDGRRYAEVGSPSDRESIHELRDGTVYANL